MMNKLSGLDWIALILVIVGGLNWGLVGALNFDLVEALLGSWPVVVNLVYIVVGLSAIYVLAIASKLAKK